jgi:hypothetical protein
VKAVRQAIDRTSVTFKLYRDIYVSTHFAPFFRTVDRLTSVGAEDYISARLRKVQRNTIKKEVTTLRRFARWAVKRGYLAQMPEFETPGPRVLGTRSSHRKSTFQVFSEEEIGPTIEALPEKTKPRRVSKPEVLRAAQAGGAEPPVANSSAPARRPTENRLRTRLRGAEVGCEVAVSRPFDAPTEVLSDLENLNNFREVRGGGNRTPMAVNR